MYLCLGLSLSLALFALMDRLQVDRRIALLITILFALSPSTILYENLLFYEYPLTLLLCLSALFLHRYATAGRLRDGIVFFSALALISGIRSVYNLAWFMALVAFVTWASHNSARRTPKSAAIPALLLLAFYTKHAILFHNLVPGGKIYTAISLSTLDLPPGALDSLIDSGKISPILRTDPFALSADVDTVAADQHLAQISPPPPPTGIPELDECTKSIGIVNWNCTWLENLLAIHEKNSLVVLRHYSSAYLNSVRGNVGRYFLPDTKGWPFDGRTDDPNAQLLARPLAVYSLVTTGVWPPLLDRPWLSYFFLPALFVFGLIRLLRRRTLDPASLTLAFFLANIIYLTLVVFFFTFADQNRIRTEVSPYFAVLLGLLLTSLRAKFVTASEPPPTSSEPSGTD